MRTRNWITLMAMAAALAMTAWAADVSGKWTAQMPGRNGQTRDVTYAFKADGDKLTGSMSFAQGDMQIQDGTVSGDEIKFTRTREGGDQTQEFTAKRAN